MPYLSILSHFPEEISVYLSWDENFIALAKKSIQIMIYIFLCPPPPPPDTHTRTPLTPPHHHHSKWWKDQIVLAMYIRPSVSVRVRYGVSNLRLTLKAPRKSASVNVVCCIFLQTFQTYILHIGKQCGPKSDCS